MKTTYHYDITDDPCHGCRFAVKREDPYMFERPYVCTNRKRLEDMVSRTITVLEMGRLDEAYRLLGDACTMNDSMERKGWIEPEVSTIIPYCHEKEKKA